MLSTKDVTACFDSAYRCFDSAAYRYESGLLELLVSDPYQHAAIAAAPQAARQAFMEACEVPRVFNRVLQAFKRALATAGIGPSRRFRVPVGLG